jgi:predicted Zn finger-like uncharacterized protein
MIVTCTSCQARFRIADEKIGPKGAKVRCSKCKNVFVAKPATAAGEAKAPPKDPFAAGLPDPTGPAGPAADPFAAVQPDPFADPFAAPLAGPPRPDPFAAPGPPAGSKTGAHHLPVTDLSDLAGGVAAAPFPAGVSSLAPPLPSAPASPSAAGQGEAAGSVASADDLVLEEPSRAIPVAPPPLPSAAPAFDFGMGGELAEPSPADLAGPAPSFEFGVPGTDLGEGSEPVSGLELAGSGGAVLGGAASAGADPFLAHGAAAPFGAEHAGEMGGLRIPTVTEPIAPEKAPPPAPAQPAIPPRRKAGAGPLSAPAPRGRLQGFLASAVSLAALLAVAAGLLSWWLRDVAAPDAIGRGPVVATGVRGGLYETAAGRPVLFVRGEVRSRSDGPLGRVAVRAEVLLGGEVGARAEGLAGALPTPEEVAQIGGPEDAARLRSRVASRAPERLEAGASLPFLVIFDAVPEGLRDAVFRVVAEARPAGPARAP